MLDTEFESKMEAWAASNSLAAGRLRDGLYRMVLRRGRAREMILRREARVRLSRETPSEARETR